MDETKTHEMMDYNEAAALLRVAPGYLRHLVSAKKVPAHRPFGMRGRVLFIRSELEQLVRAS